MDQAVRMDRMYRHQRHIYDLTRKYYLIGRDQLLGRMTIDGGDRVLEMGCGTGRNLVNLARLYPGARFYGLDASAEMLMTAQRKVVRASLQNCVQARRSLAEDLCHRRTFDLEKPFDVIFFSYALSMIPAWQLATETALANLKAGGDLFVLDFGDGGDLPEWFRKPLTKWLALFGVYHRPELLDYMQQLQARGAGKLQVETIGRRYSFIAHLQKN